MIEFSTSPMSQFYLPIRTYIEELGAPHSKLGSGDLPLKYVQKVGPRLCNLGDRLTFSGQFKVYNVRD